MWIKEFIWIGLISIDTYICDSSTGKHYMGGNREEN